MYVPEYKTVVVREKMKFGYFYVYFELYSIWLNLQVYIG